jgi:glycosyltransferase involved in cell wall biosynthesis
VVAISKFAGDEAVDILGVESERVRVIHSGPGFSPREVVREVQAIRGPYLLCVGTLSSTKNVPFLISAFERSGVDQTLALVGGRAPGVEDVERAIAASPRRDRIVVISGASDAEIDVLYRNATALLLPSHYEGFGFTPLEAMARDCPVLASDIPVVREISGDGAWLLPLDDIDQWAFALRQIVADGQLRGALIQSGASTVRRYSWQTTARRLCELFREVGASAGKAPPRGR